MSACGKWALLGLGLGVVLGVPGRAWADVDSGLDFLETSRRSDGGIGSLPLRDTAVAAQAWASVSRPLGLTSPESIYLFSTPAVEHGPAAWRLMGLVAAQDDDPEAAQALIAQQNADGGWGPHPGWASSVHDTALVTEALARSGHGGIDALSDAADYLIAAQGGGGGWAFEGNEPSLTASLPVLSALVSVERLLPVSGAIAEGAAFVEGLQAGDGSFGLSPHTLADSAWALTLLGQIGGDAEVFADGIAYLTGEQLEDGSWEGDAWSTAQAVRALSGEKPNLRATQIAVVGDGGSAPVEGEPTFVVVTVVNDGRLDATATAEVDIHRVLDGGSAVQKLGTVTAPALGLGESAEVSVTWDTTDVAGDVYLRATVDVADSVDEIDEGDNVLYDGAYLTPRVDVALTDADLDLLPEDAGLEEAVRITATVHNRGGTAANNFAVHVYLGDPAAGGELLHAQTLSLLPSAAADVVYEQVYPEGEHTLYVLADAEDVIVESLENNNRASATFSVSERYDFAGSHERIWASAEEIVEPEPVIVSAIFYNIREDTAENVPFQCFVYNTAQHTSISDREPIGQPFIVPELPGDGSATIECSFDTTGWVGRNYIYVVADPDDVFPEIREDNNEAAVPVFVYEWPNLMAEAVNSSRSSAIESQVANVGLRVSNTGGVTLQNVPVAIYVGDPDAGGEHLLPDPIITSINPDQSVNSPTVPWDTSGLEAGTYTLYGVVDPDGLLSESNEGDNTFTRDIVVNARADLAITESDISFDPASPEEGDEVTVSVTYQNLSATTASGTIITRVYDGDPDSGGSLVYEDSRSSLGNTSHTFTFPWSTTDQVGTHTFYVHVDPEGAIDERYPLNNMASRALTVTESERPDFVLTADDITLTPWRGVSPGEGVTVTALVHNRRNKAAADVHVRLWLGDPDDGGVAVGSDAVVAVPALGQVAAIIGWTTPGSLLDAPLYVEVDPDEVIDEIDEANNQAGFDYKSRLADGTQPTDLRASVSGRTVTLDWDASPLADAAGYLVWRDRTWLNQPEPLSIDAASASSASSSYPVENAYDGNTGTYWRTNSTPSPWWFEVSLPGPRVLTDVSLRWQGSYRGRDYEIQGWDGSDWQTLFSIVDNGDNVISHEMTAFVQTDRYRVYVTRSASSSYLGIYELSLEGIDGLLNTRTYDDVDVAAGAYTYTVTALSQDGWESPDSNGVDVTLLPPAAPTGLSATPDYSRVDLDWDDSADVDFASWMVYRDAELILPSRVLDTGEMSADASSDSGSSYVAGEAIDESASSYWRSTSGERPTWWSVDLGQEYVVTSVYVDWQASYRASSYILQGWDGDSWADLVTVVDDDTEKVTLTPDIPFATRNLRLYIAEGINGSYVGLENVIIQGADVLLDSELVDTHLLAQSYVFSVRALSRLGELGAVASAEVDVPPAIPPASLSYTTGVNRVDLEWPAVANPTALSYLVERDGVLLHAASERKSLEGTVASAESDSGSSYVPSKAIDGSNSSYWRTASSTQGPWFWQVDFPGAQVVTEVELLWNSSYPPVNYQVQGFDGENWRTLDEVVGLDGNTQLHTFDTPFAGTRFRVLITERSHSSYVGLSEANISGFAVFEDLEWVDSDVANGDYTYAVSVINAVGEVSAPREADPTLTLSAPTAFTADVDGDDVDLSWNYATSDPIAGFRLERGGALLNGPETAIDYTEDATIEASSTYNSSYLPAYAIDDATNTRWYGGQAQPSWWLATSWDEPREIAGLSVDWYNTGSRGYDYVIQTLEGADWITQVAVIDNPYNNTVHRFPKAVTTSAVRLRITRVGSNNYPGITEMRVHPLAPLTQTSLRDRNVASGSHTYTLWAQDPFGGLSAPVTANATVGDSIAPPNLTSASATGSEVSLGWSASPSAGVLGYVAFRNGVRVSGEQNLAPISTPVPSSTASTSSSYQPTNAIDGNTSTRWRSGTGTEWTFELRYPTEHRFDRVSLLWNSSYRGVDFRIETWDGAAWRVEAVVEDNALSFVEVELPSTLTTDIVRIAVTEGSGSYLELYEVELIEATLIEGLTFTETLSYNGLYHYCVAAVSADETSKCSNVRSVEVGETQAPAAPGNLRVSGYTKSNISLAWDPNLEPDLYGYRVYYEPQVESLNTAPIFTTTYTHSSVIVADTLEYTYRVAAVDVNGNEGEKSEPVTFGPELLQAPPNLAAQVLEQDVTLTWDAQGDPLFKTYSLYRDSALIKEGLTTREYVDEGVSRGTHGYQIAGVDLFGRLGLLSDVVEAELTDVDLAVADTSLFFLPQKPSELDDVIVHVTVRNRGDSATPETAVSFYDGDPDDGGVAIGNTTVAAMEPGDLKVAQITWELTGEAGEHTIYAVIDPADALVEFNETNNVAAHDLPITEVPELTVEITSVDPEAFPEVLVKLNVTDPSGEPVVGLDERSLFLFEDDVAQSPLDIVENTDESISDPTVNIVFVVDSSGSMDSEWRAVPELISQFEDELRIRDINLISEVFSLGGASHGYPGTRDGLFDGQPYTVNSEDWGPSTTWHCSQYGWTPDAVQIVVPVSDEDAHSGSGYSAADAQTIQEAIEACASRDVLVFPLWGDGSAQTVIDSMELLGAATQADAFYYENINEILEFMVLTVLNRVAQYEVTYTTSNTLRDGTFRDVRIEADYRGAPGEDTGTYQAPADTVLDLAAIAAVTDPTTPVAGDDVSLIGQVQNLSAVTLEAVPAWLKLERQGGGSLILGGLQDLGPLEPGEVAELSASWVAVPGTWTLTVVADPEDAIEERSEDDNQASKVMRIPGVEGYEFAVYASEMRLDPAAPTKGDEVQIAATVHNFGLDAEAVLVQLYHGDPANGGVRIGNDQVIAHFGAYSSEALTFSWQTFGEAGPTELHLLVDPYDRFRELSEANNHAVLDVDIAQPPYEILLSTDSPTYGPDETASLTARVINHDVGDLEGLVAFSIEGLSETLIAEVGEVAVGPLLGNPHPDWPAYIPLTYMDTTAGMGASSLSVGISFADAISQAGISSPFDPASLRISEHDAAGAALASWPVTFIPQGADGDVGKVLWQPLPEPDGARSERHFRLYFDGTAAGHTAVSGGPQSDDLLVFSDEAGALMGARRGADGAYGEAFEIDTVERRMRAITVADLNGDGLEDIIAGDYDRDVYAWYGQAGGGFVKGEALYNQSGSGDTYMIQAYDFDGDGDLDIVRAYDSTPRLLTQDDNGVFVSTNLPGAPSTVSTAQLADLDADGFPDLVVGVNGGRVGWYRNRRDGTFNDYISLFSVGGNAPYGLAVADFDGDGLLDLIFNNGSAGDGYYAAGTGVATFGSALRNTSIDTPSYARFRPVDFNADGIADLMIMPNDSGGTPVQLRQGYGDGGFGLPQVIHTFAGSGYAMARSGPLEVGRAVTSSPTLNTHSEAEISVSWNTGVNFAGAYTAVARLYQGGDERARDFAPFDIVSDPALDAHVETDAPAYTPFDRPLISAMLTNTTANDAVRPTEGRLTVEDPEGAEILSEAFSVGQLLPGEALTWVAQQDLYGAAPGTYTVILEGTSGGVVLTEAFTTFEVLETLAEALAGTLTVDPEQALEGDLLTLSWSLENRGNADLLGIEAFVDIVPAESEDVAASFDLEVDLDSGDQTSADIEQGSADLGLGTWDARLGVMIDGEPRILAAVRFIIINITGSLVVDPEIGEGGEEDFTLSWAVRNRGDLRLEALDIQIELERVDGGEGATVGSFQLDLDPEEEATGQEVQLSDTLTIGEYEAVLANTRTEGDVILARVPFTVVDTIAPVSELVVDGVLIADEDTATNYAPSATRYILQATDNFSGVADIRFAVDAAPEDSYFSPLQFLEEGPHALSFFARDFAGVDEGPHSFAVVVDDSDPVIRVLPYDEEPCVGVGTLMRWEVADLSPVEVAVTYDGDPVEGSVLVEAAGEHTLIIEAVDILGHSATRTVTFEATDDACACATGDAIADLDDDGILACEGDCDDQDATIFPGAIEACDGSDGDCDGTIDEDSDGDGYDACDDCDEGDVDIFPGATEVDNGLDDDCDGSVDEELCVEDSDGDGYTGLGGDCAVDDASIHPGADESPAGLADGVDNDCDGAIDEGTEITDDDGDGLSEEEGDCDDSNAFIAPTIVEEEGSPFYSDGVDNNCDGVIDDGSQTDGDGDGYLPSGGDCDDSDPNIYPGAPEDGGSGTGIANGVDDNCDGRLDEETNIRDDDFDGASEDDGDCNDSDFSIFPGADETFDGRDEDCDGIVDEGARPCDLDGDGFTELEGDCDDSDADINPDADEVCDGLDNQCDGEVDEGDICVVDNDGDGFTPDDGDCDDDNADINPDADETCDEVDEDCDGDVDEDVSTTTFYPDADGDGHGAPTGDAITTCEGEVPGYAPGDDDCDDGDAAIYPGAADDQCDTIDNDCDGTADEDCEDLPPDSTPTDGTPPGEGDGYDCTCTSGDASPGSLLGLMLMLLSGMFIRRRAG